MQYKLHKAGRIMRLAVLVNLFIVFQEARYFAHNLHSLKRSLIWFTFDSNIFLGIVSLLLVFGLINSIRRGFAAARKSLLLLKYAAVTGVMCTLVTVVCYLGPVVHAKELFTGDNLYAHLIMPLTAFLSFVLLERGAELKPRHFVAGILPALIYGIVYVKLVQKQVWTDHYHLMMTDPWYISMGVVAAVFILIAVVIAVIYAVPEKKFWHMMLDD